MLLEVSKRKYFWIVTGKAGKTNWERAEAFFPVGFFIFNISYVATMENACMHDTGEFLMKIIKIVNNNIVTSLDEQNREIIVMGRGLGFGRKPGMPIEDEKVEKVFRLNSAGENQKLVDIIQDIPLEHIKAADQIIEYAKSMLGERLKETIYLSLIDHIDGAIDRYKNQIQFTNPLLWEIKQ